MDDREDAELRAFRARVEADVARLKAEWERLTTRELVERIVSDPRQWKLALSELARRAPDADAARAVVEAHEAERAAPWLAAELLIAIGHPLAASVLKRMMGDEHLSLVYRAAEGLGELSSAEADEARRVVLDTYLRGDLHVRPAALALAPRMPAPQLEALLRADALRGRMLGVECAGHLLRSGAPELEGDPERWAPLFERLLRSGEPCVFRRSTRTALEAFVRSAR